MSVLHIMPLCCMFIYMLLVHNACAFCATFLHANAAFYTFCQCSMSISPHAPCPCCFSMLLIYDGCPCCMSMLRARTSCLCLHAACLWWMKMLHEHEHEHGKEFSYSINNLNVPVSAYLAKFLYSPKFRISWNWLTQNSMVTLLLMLEKGFIVFYLISLAVK
jgi:hypothetical protein